MKSFKKRQRDKNTVIDLRNLPEVDSLTQLIKDGANQLVAQTLEVEVEVFINAIAERLEDGRLRIVRNGYLNGYLVEHDIMTGVDQVKVKVPRVRDRGDGGENML